MNLEIKKLEGHEADKFESLVKVFEDVFEMKNFIMPEKSHLDLLLKNQSFFVFVALIDDTVVGGLTSYILNQYYSPRPLIYIFDLAVKNEFQRQGIGKKLMTTILEYSKDIGVEEVFVQADEMDDYALEFYHSTGGIAEKVVHFYYPLNK